MRGFEEFDRYCEENAIPPEKHARRLRTGLRSRRRVVRAVSPFSAEG
jgi:hypothetical protein